MFTTLLTYIREFNWTIQHCIHADLGNGKYIVEVGSLKLCGGHRTKRKEMDTSDVDPQVHSQWQKWWISQEDPQSINDARVVEYVKEKLQRSRRPLSCQQPEGWIEDMSDFVRSSDPRSEDLESLIVRFEIQFPWMENRFARGFFRHVRDDIELVPDFDTIFE